MILPDGQPDISTELAKVEDMAAHLSDRLFEMQSIKPDHSEEKQNLKGLYWIADTLRETAAKAYAEMYPGTVTDDNDLGITRTITKLNFKEA